eukprot:CAMPEP_0170549886 /NCGR_PEP_ID=MMETSP0211-20121228/7996_1 /TAXON_ID=311385 /ORGANISM="Pseudokeronopsis sp., Strain OXSARD2" /LENGTH=134 /DNA_ID=CAMNT_0010856137 /DNA_START=164 /DNA_END=568 /DNA_ORIENTATION=-
MEEGGLPGIVRYDEVYYPRTDKRMIKGNQYAFEGNKFKKKTPVSNALEDSINVIISNQEIGPNSEHYFPLTRAKLFEMKNLRLQNKIKSYNNLYNDGIMQSKFHERQKFGGHYKTLTVDKIDEEDEMRGNKNLH